MSLLLAHQTGLVSPGHLICRSSNRCCRSCTMHRAMLSVNFHWSTTAARFRLSSRVGTKRYRNSRFRKIFGSVPLEILGLLHQNVMELRNIVWETIVRLPHCFNSLAKRCGRQVSDHLRAHKLLPPPRLVVQRNSKEPENLKCFYEHVAHPRRQLLMWATSPFNRYSSHHHLWVNPVLMLLQHFVDFFFQLAIAHIAKRRLEHERRNVVSCILGKAAPHRRWSNTVSHAPLGFDRHAVRIPLHVPLTDRVNIPTTDQRHLGRCNRHSV